MKSQASPSNRIAPSPGRAQSHSREWWFEHYQTWINSDLSRPEYCAAHGLKYSSFYNWACQFQKPPAAPNKPSHKTNARSPFVRALIMDEPSAPPVLLSLMVNDVTLRFESGLPPQDLAAWVKSLRALSC